MPFHSLTFIYGFLPVALAAFYLSRVFSKKAALFVLLQLSLVFYAWEFAWFLPLLVTLTFINYGMDRS